VIHGWSTSRRIDPATLCITRRPVGPDQGLSACREGHVSGTAADNRLFVEAVLYRYRAGIPWRDLPERFGPWKIVYQRFDRWAKSGVFEHIFKLLASDHDNEYMMIDATIVRANQHSAGARKNGEQAIGSSPGSLRNWVAGMFWMEIAA
jgi:transposase